MCNLDECYENENGVEKVAAISNPMPAHLNLGMKRGVEKMINRSHCQINDREQKHHMVQ